MCEITQQENCFLNAMVNGICTHYDEWLHRTYMWPMDEGRLKEEHGQIITNYENTTVEIFAQFRQDPVPVAAIMEWGGINRNTHDEINDYIYNLNPDNFPIDAEHRGISPYSYHMFLWNLSLGQRYNPQNPNYARGSASNWRIASWTKILAAYDPQHYFIYDSRVAIALSYIALHLSQPVIWIIPGFSVAMRDRQAYNNFRIAIGRGRRPTLGRIPQGWTQRARIYYLYLELLKRLAQNHFIRDQYDIYDTDRTDNFMRQITPGGRNSNDMLLPPTGDEIRAAYEMVAKQFIGEEDKFQNARKTFAIMAHLEKMFFMMKEDVLKKQVVPGMQSHQA